MSKTFLQHPNATAAVTYTTGPNGTGQAAIFNRVNSTTGTGILAAHADFGNVGLFNGTTPNARRTFEITMVARVDLSKMVTPSYLFDFRPARWTGTAWGISHFERTCSYGSKFRNRWPFAVVYAISIGR